MTARGRLFLGALPALLAGLAVLHLWLGAAPGLRADRLWPLLSGAMPDGFAEVQFLQAALPRLVVGALVGAALGLAGSLMQQATRNPLASPMTLGAASGAWLAMILATLLAPGLAAAQGEWVAMAGAAAATGLVLAIAGMRGLMSVGAVLAGMAVTLMCGAFASVLLLLKSPYFGHLFLWGAGDLTQTGWASAAALAPRLVIGGALALAFARVLTLIRLGADAAEGRGLRLWPALAGVATVALWLTGLSVAHVGMIGFVGLVAPNLARLLGARRAGAELPVAALLGSGMLIGADALVLALRPVMRDMVPTGAATALIGAPALIWLLARPRAREGAEVPFHLPAPAHRLRPLALVVLLILPLPLGGLALALGKGPGGWALVWPQDLILALRWPRVVAGAGAGMAMAVAGVVLQRLVRNPLAGPDVLGLSSGASFALVMGVILTGGSIHQGTLPLALAGSLSVLIALHLLGRRMEHDPAVLALVGIALGAGLDAAVKLALASGTAEAFSIIGWLSGSTYRVGPGAALGLLALGIGGMVVALSLSPLLTLVSAGAGLAAGRGVSLAFARPGLMSLGGGLAAGVTALMGPVTFVGLIAPHLAALLGAQWAGAQVAVAGALGASLMILSDWAGRVPMQPFQLPAGAIAAALGGIYFIAMIRRGSRRAG